MFKVDPTATPVGVLRHVAGEAAEYRKAWLAHGLTETPDMWGEADAHPLRLVTRLRSTAGRVLTEMVRGVRARDVRPR